MSVLNDPAIEQILTDLHSRSDAQLAEIEQYVIGARRSRSATREEDFKLYRSDKLLAIRRDKAESCYQICRAIDARQIVEIGTSYGVSTLYLAAAVRDNINAGGGSGLITATEYEPSKVIAAMEVFRRAGLSQIIRLLKGDFRETLKKIDAPVDLVLIDAWKDAPPLALEMMEPWLRSGSIVLCDDMDLQPKEYHEALIGHGFRTVTLPFRDGLGLSIRC